MTKGTFFTATVLPLSFFFLSCTDNLPVPAGLNTVDEIPSSVTRPVLRATLPASWDENWFSSPAVFDLDNDGSPEIIASRHSVLYVWNSDGSKKWRAPVGENASSANDHGSNRMYCSPVVGDLNNDGYGEIAICYSNKAAVYDHQGDLLPGWPVAFPNASSEIRSIAACDLDNDGVCEIAVVKTSDGPVTAVWNLSGAMVAGWPQVIDRDRLNDYGGYNQNVGCADLDGNGEPEIVCTYDICHIGIMKRTGEPWPAHPLFSGAFACNVPMFHSLDLALQGWGPDGSDRDEFTDSPPVFADLDNDGLPEIILFSDHEKAGEYVNRGNSLWALNPDMTRVQGFETPPVTGMPLSTGYENNIVQVAPSPCVTRLGSGSITVIAPSYDGWVRCYDAGGNERWKAQFNASGEPFVGAGEACAVDLDNNNVPEIVFTTYSTQKNRSNLFVLNASGALLHRVPLEGRGSMAAPTIDDCDNDGDLEIVISLKDALGSGKGGVQVWEVVSAKANNRDWPTGRGNCLRTGNFGGK
ncbi:MAG: VCBS repeat-containing protein [Chitinispirillaceae bacterium]|nr:VCBS repeat-containing protein [Chitinispirillaceae bacterium]